MKYLPSIIRLATVSIFALAFLAGDTRSQGLYDQLKEYDSRQIQPQTPPVHMTAKEVCTLAGNEGRCRIQYLANNYTIAWRGTVPANDGGVVEILVRGGEGVFCANLLEVNDYSNCFPLRAVR